MNFQKLIDEARNNKDIVFLKKFLTPAMSWEQCVNCIHYNYNSDNNQNRHIERFINRQDGSTSNIFAYRHLNLCIFNIVENDLNIFQQVEPILNNFNFNKSKYNSRILIDLVGNESKYNIHKDKTDGISWQQLGTMEWRVFGDVDGEYEKPLDLDKDLSYLKYKSYIFEPGDIIFIPKGVVHQVIVEEPRASILLNSGEY